MKTIGELIVEKMEAARADRAEVCASIGISRSTLSFLERGQRRPSPELLAKIVEVLDIPWEEVIQSDACEPAIRALLEDDETREAIIKSAIEATK